MPIVKVCTYCHKKKDIKEFGLDNSKLDKYSNQCKLCKREISKKTKLKNRKNVLACLKRCRINNKEKRKNYKRVWDLNNNARIKQYKKSQRISLHETYMNQLLKDSGCIELKNNKDFVETYKVIIKIKRICKTLEI